MNSLTKILLCGLIGTGFICAGEAPKEYPKGKLGEMVKLGEDILLHTNTHALTKDFVGNKLNCANCHLKGNDGKPGTSDGISSLIGTAAALPAYSTRENTVQTLQNRAVNCFIRSMDGKRLTIDSKASIAITAYITWLSTGMPIQMNAESPVSALFFEKYKAGKKKFSQIQKKATHENYLSGAKLYETKCAMCHGMNGKGMGTFPPLWGKGSDGKWLSYSSGAGMSKLNKAPVWIQSNMPLGQGDTLSDQEAADVALYIDAQERASFNLVKALAPTKESGHYNSEILDENHTVRSNFKAFGLDIDIIRGDKKID